VTDEQRRIVLVTCTECAGQGRLWIGTSPDGSGINGHEVDCARCDGTGKITVEVEEEFVEMKAAAE